MDESSFKQEKPSKAETNETLEKKVLFEVMPEVATAYICVNNGEMNILSLEVLGQLEKTLADLKQMEDIKYAIFHSGRIVEKDGAVAKISSSDAECSGYFSTGANVREMSELSKEQAYEYSKYGQSIMKSIQELPQTTIAVIPRGFCVGGGLELSMTCKYRVATDGSLFQMPEMKLGIIPGWRGTQNLPHIIGVKEAEDWINNNGRTMKAKKAFELGLVDYIVPNPLGETNAMLQNGTELVSRSKNDPRKVILRDMMIENDEDEARVFAESWDTGVPKGITEFLEEQRKKSGK